jgi:hypothetical protein
MKEEFGRSEGVPYMVRPFSESYYYYGSKTPLMGLGRFSPVSRSYTQLTEHLGRGISTSKAATYKQESTNTDTQMPRVGFEPSTPVTTVNI